MIMVYSEVLFWHLPGETKITGNVIQD